MNIEGGLKAGTLCQGRFHGSREKLLEGYVFVEGENESDSYKVLIPGCKNFERAIHNDFVEVEIVPEEQGPSTLEDNVTASAVIGAVIGIIEMNTSEHVGVFERPMNWEDIFYLFVPYERRIPRIQVPAREVNGQLFSRKVTVRIDYWPDNSKYPQGHFQQDLGEIGEAETEITSLLVHHKITDELTYPDLFVSLPKPPLVITKEDRKQRRDMTDVTVFTVDPPRCREMDDALHCRRMDNGHIEVGVHIADVSHFVRPNTALDAEAATRGSSVYLVGEKIGMLPDVLSSNLCSLRQNEERFAFSVIFEMTEKAEILSTSFFKTIINSKAALSYAEAQKRIENTDDTFNDDISISLRLLNKLSKILEQKKIDNGSITLSKPEVRFVMDRKTGDPINIVKKDLYETNSMVEEFMFLANCSVAKKIFEKFPDSAVLRRNPAPRLSSFDYLIKAGLSKGFEISVESNKALAESLEKAVLPENPYFNVMLRRLAARCMAPSSYISSGVLLPADYYHYGSAVPYFTHFTSPIRRYSDILVHWQLEVAIGADVSYPDLADKKKIREICNYINYRNKEAGYCKRAFVNLYNHILFKDRVVEEEGHILFISEHALEIQLPRYGLECTLDLRSKYEENDAVSFEYDEKVQSQTSEGVTLRLGDTVTVQLHAGSDITHPKIVLKLVKPYIRNFSVSPLITTELQPITTEAPPRKRQKLCHRCC